MDWPERHVPEGMVSHMQDAGKADPGAATSTAPPLPEKAAAPEQAAEPEMAAAPEKKQPPPAPTREAAQPSPPQPGRRKRGQGQAYTDAPNSQIRCGRRTSNSWYNRELCSHHKSGVQGVMGSGLLKPVSSNPAMTPELNVFALEYARSVSAV